MHRLWRKNRCLMAVLVLPLPLPLHGQTTSGAWFVKKDPSWVKKLSQPQYEISLDVQQKR
jgi:hypothetical protein